MGQAQTWVDVFFCHKTEHKIEGLVSKTPDRCHQRGLHGAIGQHVWLLTERLVVQAHPGSVIVASLKSESNQMFRPIGKQKMLEEITSSQYPK